MGAQAMETPVLPPIEGGGTVIVVQANDAQGVTQVSVGDAQANPAALPPLDTSAQAVASSSDVASPKSPTVEQEMKMTSCDVQIAEAHRDRLKLRDKTTDKEYGLYNFTEK